ncbi:MAG TPA: hypothetical protein VEC13_02530 [Candidatus Paceibacterota bacterium]|nr:hypothetical protein [Candidatus Paceibacterota bacterium]
MRIVLIGLGNVGKALKLLLEEKGYSVDYVIKQSGVFDKEEQCVDAQENFASYIDSDSFVFISTPSFSDFQINLLYYESSLKKGAKIITCEKAVLANRFDLALENKKSIKYSATVGGGSGRLNAISDFEGDIEEIRCILNGTLNYIADKLEERLSEEEVFKEVVEKGFAEPGSNDFDEAIQNELKDVLYKTVILANHSGLFKELKRLEDLEILGYKKGARCAAVLTPNEIKAGFQEFPDKTWFSKGVNNVLYINNQKIVEGPGAGSRATAERMYKDFVEIKEP